MSTRLNENGPGCGPARELLNGFLDNRLSARQTWVLEKHLADCPACAQLARQMEQTVSLLRQLDRRDTSDFFMANLHARLDAEEAASPARRSPIAAIREWPTLFLETLDARRWPAVGLGLALTALVALLLMPQQGPVPVPETQPAAPQASINQPLRRNVALSAANPLDDPAAANLLANVGESGGATDAEQTQD
jgi:anti-sigma factor RsiW